MKAVILLITVLLPGSCLFAQSKRNAIEFTPYIRYINYGTVADGSLGSPVFTTLSVKGTGYGLNADYVRRIGAGWQARIGIGYYRYSFDDLENRDPRPSVDRYPARSFDHPLPGALVYTDKYWYNTLTAQLGGERLFAFKNGLVLSVGLAVQSYYTYSQLFQVYDPAGAPSNTPDYKRKEGRFFGFSVNSNITLTKNIGNVYLGPKLLLPLFDQWRQDAIFGEIGSSRHKWRSGIGGGITAGYRF